MEQTSILPQSERVGDGHGLEEGAQLEVDLLAEVLRGAAAAAGGAPAEGGEEQLLLDDGQGGESGHAEGHLARRQGHGRSADGQV